MKIYDRTLYRLAPLTVLTAMTLFTVPTWAAYTPVSIDANTWLSNHPKQSDYTEQLIAQGEPVLIDFSTIADGPDLNAAREKMRERLGISFTTPRVLISTYKNKLMFTPLTSNDPTTLLQTMEQSQSGNNRMPGLQGLAAEPDKPDVPHVSFYINVYRQISAQDCTFRRSAIFDHYENVSFCTPDSNISLVYRVTLERSLPFETSGSSTPDAKIVRISLDNESAGAGIKLNDQLNYFYNWTTASVVFDAWLAEYSTSAIAQDYRIAVSTDNNKVSILKSYPGNLNSKFNHTESSGFSVGVSGGVDVSKEGPKASVSGSYSYNQQRSLSYDTQDYRVERNSSSPQQISFSWIRQEYPNTNSLLTQFSGAVWEKDYKIDTKRISPISYMGFVPNLDVIYFAKPTETGTTQFTLNASVNLRPIYYGIYYHVGMWFTYDGTEPSWQFRRIADTQTFTVNWLHPVFSGGRPVNLQMGVTNSCVSANDGNSVAVANCDLASTDQSFIYDQYSRYVSARDTTQCLDGNNLSTLQPCNMTMAQRWKWKPNSDALINLDNNMILGHDIRNGKPSLYYDSGEPVNVSFRTLTAYTQIFTKD
ncbi:MAG: leukocidin family pore-forming toxin [Enterobacteriaceae bacterium]